MQFCPDRDKFPENGQMLDVISSTLCQNVRDVVKQ